MHREGTGQGLSQCFPCWSGQANIIDLSSVQAPAFAFCPDFAFPNRSRCLQTVDTKTGSLEGDVSMRRRCDNDHR